jgi:O-methyltransferase involved in polyketide biosynthesis
MYLTRDTVATMLRQLAALAPGSTLVMTPPASPNATSRDGPTAFARQAWKTCW